MGMHAVPAHADPWWLKENIPFTHPPLTLGEREGVRGQRKETNMRENVEKALALIRPVLQADGGDVELVEVTTEGVVKVRLKGACGG